MISPDEGVLYCSDKCLTLAKETKQKPAESDEGSLKGSPLSPTPSPPSEYDDPSSATYIDPIHRSEDGRTTGVRLTLVGNTINFNQEDIANSIGSYYKESSQKKPTHQTETYNTQK